jgi:propanol-preferring alcohol dehydrogenase
MSTLGFRNGASRITIHLDANKLQGRPQMRAMVISKIQSLEQNSDPLELVELPVPEPGPKELLVQVSACGVCHTELDEIEGRTPPPSLPVIPGHQVVGTIEACGPGIKNFRPGDRVGVGWIYSACGRCSHCRLGNENLCSEFRATGRDVNGGYAEYMVVKEDFAFRIPHVFSDSEAAPLLCAGAIGYRSLRLAQLRDGEALGLTGFGASAHLVLQMARHLYPRTRIYVFARSERERAFALEMGAVWAGDTVQCPPRPMDRIIDTTPAWLPVLEALSNLAPGGRLIINAIRKEGGDKSVLQELDYVRHLWMEKEIKTVANVSRRDIREFLELAAQIPIRPEVQEFSLEEANVALRELRERKIRGAKVINLKKRLNQA